jgi:hypothetical protein
MQIVRGGAVQQAAAEATASAAAKQNDLLQQNYVELKIITRHLSEIADAAFGEDDIDLEAN